MASAGQPRTGNTNETVFLWEGKDKNGKPVQGELRAAGRARVDVTLRRQGITVVRVRKKPRQRQRKIRDKDICVFTRQLSTMLKAGVPLLQSFDMVARGHANPAVTRLLLDIRADVVGAQVRRLALSAHEHHLTAYDTVYLPLEIGRAHV